MASPNLNPQNPQLEQELEQVYRIYAALMRGVGAESGLGGKLLYAGEPDEPGCRVLRAANIAGAASLASSASAAALRHAMRQGVIDFVVNTLDEALRVLKNEIRKKEPVSAGVSLSQETICKEMIHRGVLPDLLAQHLPRTPDSDTFITQGARRVEEAPLPAGLRFITLSIPPAWSHRTAAIEALMLGCLPPGDAVTRRWLRLAPRYLGAGARRLRSLACNEQTAARLMEQIAQPPPE